MNGENDETGRDRYTYRFVSKAFGDQLNSFNWYGREGMTYHITDHRDNLFTNIFIIVQQPVTQSSWKLINIIRIKDLRTVILGNWTRIPYRLYVEIQLWKDPLEDKSLHAQGLTFWLLSLYPSAFSETLRGQAGILQKWRIRVRQRGHQLASLLSNECLIDHSVHVNIGNRSVSKISNNKHKVKWTYISSWNNHQ